MITPARRFRPRWRSRSLRVQVATIIALVGLSLVALNALVLSSFINHYVFDREGVALAQQTADLSRCSTDGVVITLFAAQQDAENVLRTVLGSTQNEHLIVIDSSGAVRYNTPMPNALRSTLLTHLRRDFALGELSMSGSPAWHEVSKEIVTDAGFACPVASVPAGSVSNAPLRGGLLLAEDSQVAQSAWRRLVDLVLAAGLAVTVMAVLAGLVAGEVMARPLHAVTRAARAIAAGDLRRRVSPRGPSEINEMSVAFNQMVEEVMRQRRVERDLLANISHELAAPLGLIRGYAEALADDVITTGSERTAALRAIQGETARLERLTADLLDLALLETGQVSLHVEPVPVGELLVGLRQRLAPMMQRGQVTVAVELPADLPTLPTDGQRLEQVLVNLLTNAVRHTPPGGTIVMAATTNDQGMQITVRNSGIGIPPEEQQRIWERFYQVEKGRARREHEAGVGLGLAICRSIVTVLNGTIDVQSTPNSGTTFTIWLPLHMEQTHG